MTHQLSDNILVINRRPETPTSITIGYPRTLSVQERLRVNNVLNYWLSAVPISNSGSFEILWSDDFQTVNVVGDFGTGSFHGDLTHRDAIGQGDQGFDIGLVKLLCRGNIPRTHRGTRIDNPGIRPYFVRLNHERVQVTQIPGPMSDVQALKQELRSLSNRIQQVEGGMGYGLLLISPE